MIGITGINHKSAPVEVREKLSFNEEEIVLFLERLTSETGVKEAVLLSTCNRTEVCFNLPGDDHNAEKIVKALLASKNIDLEIKKYFYFYYDSHAVKHLLEVSAGLDSMVLGENQILGQVKDAYRISSTRNYTDTVLNRLFHKAFEAGKKVRTETGVNEGASSVSYAAVELAGKIFGRIGSTPILLIGAGETGELVLQSLIERGSTNIHVTNRTFGRAESLAKKYKARVVPFENLREYLAKCDIILSSTSAPYPIITTPLMKEVMKERKNRTGFLIDLSVPRDIEDGVRDIENLFLYNIDDLEEVVA
ncbi:MAG: glutamyl-tRNA reductase, partial [Spirochaetes bacterium]